MKYNFSLRCIKREEVQKGEELTLAGMAERRVSVCPLPATIVVLMSKSSGGDCCSDEIKAAAFPSAVHLH